MIRQIVFFLVTIFYGINSQDSLSDLKNEKVVRYPCKANTKITYYSQAGVSRDGELGFFMSIEENMKKGTFISAKFSTPTVFNTSDTKMEFYFSRLDKLNIYLLKKEDKLLIRLKTVNGIVPEIESLLINNVERCKINPSTTIQTVNLMDLFNSDPATVSRPRPTELNCGERKVHYTKLITYGVTTKLGDWPWHAAMYKLQNNFIKYICGGTLISKTVVMTAAHCVTINGIKLNPSIVSVVLGKYNLFGGEETPQDKKVFEITVHEEFNYSNLDNDIALLTLKTEAVFTDYVQPACLWTSDLFDDFPADETLGTVAGWGLDQTETTPMELQQASFPRIEQLKCIKSNPLFFSAALNEQSFCAGWRNGTSACKGDSGGGFHVFIPNTPGDTSSTAPGRWYVQGIVSQSATNRETGGCDPSNYVVFTDVAKMATWINDNL